jgi:hypothetical protein
MIKMENFIKKNRRQALGLASLAVLIPLLSACGGSSSSSSNNGSSSISGTAATGLAISGGTVTAHCVSGSVTGTTATDGSYTLNLGGGQTPPCILQVTKAGTPTITLYGYATAAGHSNITPITDMVLSKALADSPAVAFNAFDSADASTINGALVAAKAYVNTQLTSAGLGTPSIDPLTGTFTVGDANDSILDALGTALASAGHTIDDLRTTAAGGTALTTLTGGGSGGFTAATAYPYTGLYGSLMGNYDSSLSSCKTGVPTNPNTFLPDFTQGTAASNLGFSIDINGNLTFAGITTSNEAGSLNISNNGEKQIVFTDYISGISLRTDTTAQSLTLQTAGGTTGCIVGASTQVQFKNIDPSTRLKKIFGNGLSLVCGAKHIRFTTEGLISVDDSTPAPFDFAAENTSNFFPSTATYLEQRFTSEGGGASKEFGLTIFMPVTFGPSPMVINVNALTVTDVMLGGTTCTAGT